MKFNCASALGDDVLRTIASFLIEKKLPERSWIQHKNYHKICLEHNREWAEERDRKANPITLQMYDTIIQSTEKIFDFVTRPPIVFIKDAMQNACFYEYFPPNAKGYLNKYGINAAEGLANGTEIKYHSISFEDSDQKRQFRLKSAQAKPGDIIDLDFPPTAINVELFADFDGDSTSEAAKKKRERKEWLDGGKGSITKDGRVVIPISLKDGKKGIQFDTNYIPGCTDLDSNHYYHDSMVSIKDHFPIEPAFSITVDKAQVCLVCCVCVCLFYIPLQFWF